MEYVQLLGIIRVFTRSLSWCKRYTVLSMVIEFYTFFKKMASALDMFKEWDNAPIASRLIMFDRNLGFRSSGVSRFFRGKKKGLLITDICNESDCEWSLKSEMFFNCTWVACNYGPFTLEAVGRMMGLTRERIRQIEVKALKRLQHRRRREQLRHYWE